MRISIINSFYFPKETGGAEVSIRHLAEGLVKRGHAVQVVCLGQEDSHEMIAGVELRRLAVFNGKRHPAFGSESLLPKALWHAIDSSNPAAAHQVADAVAAFEPDVANVNNLSGFSAAVLPALAALRIPVLMTLRDYYLTCPRTTRQRGDGNTCEKQCRDCAAYAWPRRIAARSVSHVAGVSQYVIDVHRRDGYFTGIESSVLPPPIPWPERVAPRVGKPAVCRFGYLGRVVPVKGVGLLIDEFRRACHEPGAPPMTLAIAGEGSADHLAELRARAAGLPVDFVGRVRPEDFMPGVDIAVVPSLWAEPAGRVVGEAMSFGVPVIGSGLGGMAEGIEAGRTGWRFDVGTPGSLAAALLAAAWLPDADYARFSAAARAASAGRSGEAVVAAHLAIFERLAASAAMARA
ncbi:glycosyltransferase family 4 protein [Derxia gummosa]|uniref:Glycosyltransferase family 4 protein n=1 Tax=Derxia gummosa DSM 723 TaxID=1121388 RepID=A0A8B6X2Y6_9BURK|nr:glycosyltransferase family 4 protein [Derxia gummosa]